MLVTNNTNQDYWFGPLHLPGGVGQTLTVDDTSDTSLYLTSDVVADAINNLSNLGKITCTSTASPFPRPTGTPELLHGDGSPEGIVYAGQGSMYMRRDGTGPDSLYTKTTGISISTGWEAFSNAVAGVSFRKTTAKAVTNTVTDTDLLNGEISIPANEMGTSGLLRLTAWGDWVQDSGSGNDVPVFSLKFGGTTLLKTAVATPSSGSAAASSASRYGWRVLCEILALGAANSQWATIDGKIGCLVGSSIGAGAAFATGEGAVSLFGGVNAKQGGAMFVGGNAGTVDTTSGCALVLSVINPTATATCETKLYGALIEIV